MSTLALIWAEAQSPGSGCCPHLLEILGRLFDDDLGFAYPSNRYLAERLRKSEATVERGLAALVENGFIERTVKRWGPDGGARREIRLKGYDREAEERKREERRAGRRREAAPDRGIEADAGYPRDEGQVPSKRGLGPIKMPASESLEESVEESFSDPGGSAPRAGAGPRDFRKEVFERGTRTVRSLTGRPAVKCRALIGKWLALVDDDAATVLAAIDAAEEGELAHPISWIEVQLRVAGTRMGVRRRSANPAHGSRRSGNGALSLLAERMGLPEEAGSPRPLPGRTEPSPAVALPLPVDREAEAHRMVAQGHWPRGGKVFVAADSPEGAAWGAHFERFGRQPRWTPFREGLGWFMPSAWPPKLSESAEAEA